MNNHLRVCREMRGLSQEQVAGRLGITRQTLSNWELGRSEPDAKMLVALAKLYGKPLDELMCEEPEEAPEGQADGVAEEQPEEAAEELMEEAPENRLENRSEDQPEEAPKELMVEASEEPPIEPFAVNPEEPNAP